MLPPRFLFKRLLAILLVVVCIVLALNKRWQFAIVDVESCPSIVCPPENCSVATVIQVNISGIASDLREIVQELKGVQDKLPMKFLTRLNHILHRLQPNNNLTDDEDVTDDADTCGQVYKGRLSGYPFYQTGFEVSPNCSEIKKSTSISDLVTVIMISNGDYLSSVLKGIRTYNSKLRVILASPNYDKAIEETATFNDVHVINATTDEFNTPGKIWNKMAEQTETRYVFLARDLTHFTGYSFLERLVYVLRNSSKVGVSSGATRNLTGHWKLGCYQTEIKNYLLRYSEGYSHSQEDCISCDHTSGPFMVKRRVIRQTPLSEKFQSEVLFEDWFLKLKDASVLVVNCPDAMFYVQGNSDDISLKKDLRTPWLSLAQEWQITRIFIPLDTEYMFTCEELKLTCDAWDWAEYYIMPTCCILQVAKTLQTLNNFSNLVGMNYQLDSGSQLAAVKLQAHSPWDLDGDLIYEENHFDSFKANKEMFNNVDIRFEFQNDSKKFKMYLPEIYIEMWPTVNTSSQFLPADLQTVPTLMNVLGVWVQGQANPGLYARNKYGPDHFRHARFYMFSQITEWDQYSPNGWPPCPKKHHGCLDRYPVDGNLHFIPHYFQNLGLSWDKINT